MYLSATPCLFQSVITSKNVIMVLPNVILYDFSSLPSDLLHTY